MSKAIRRRLPAVVATTLALAALCTAQAADLPLTVAQVEQVTGQTGLSTRPAKYDKLGTNFVTADGTTVITLKVGTASLYDIWKGQPAMNDQVALTGVGDDAMASKKGRYVCFKRAALGACVTGNITLPGKPVLASDAQLLQLAKLAAK